MKALKDQLTAKIAKIRKGEETGMPYGELLQQYKELKELQYEASFLEIQEQEAAENSRVSVP